MRGTIVNVTYPYLSRVAVAVLAAATAVALAGCGPRDDGRPPRLNGNSPALGEPCLTDLAVRTRDEPAVCRLVDGRWVWTRAS
jgi:hypothetical protein